MARVLPPLPCYYHVGCEGKVHYYCQLKWEKVHTVRGANDKEWSCQEHHNHSPMADKLEHAVAENTAMHGPPPYTEHQLQMTGMEAGVMAPPPAQVTLA
jgi:hypothetical protein